MKAASKLLAVAGLFFVSMAAADPVRVEGRIVNEAGAALVDAVVSARGIRTGVTADGGFSLELDSRGTVGVRIEAPGYYTFMQTLHRSDFVAGRAAVIPDIELVKRKPGRMLILFAGDSMLSRRYFEPRAGEPVLVSRKNVIHDGRKLLLPVRPYIALADFASVNMETQLSASVLTDRVPKSVTFYSPAELAEILEWAGFDYVALGNNHMYDYRDEGLHSTFAALKQTSLAYSGAGFNEDDAREPATVEMGGRDYSFLSYVGWPGTFEPSQVAERTKGGAAFGNAQAIESDLSVLPDGSISVLQLHAGLEYAEAPALSERTTLRQAVNGGADVAIGHHPHVLQGFEIVDERLIAYSLGNFLFDQYHYTTQLGMLLYVWLDGEALHRAEAVPLHINGYLPTPATGLFRHSVLTRLARLSDDSVCMRASGFHAVVESCKGKQRSTQPTRLADATSAAPSHLRRLGASPLQPLTIDAGNRPYRLGVDILRRGDFEYAGLFGTTDRTWIEGTDVSIRSGDNNRLDIRIPDGETTVRTGMKVFERVFTLSNPATVSGRIRTTGNVRVRFLLQRRRMTETLGDALANGPVMELGVWEGAAGEWREFFFDHNQPRIATRSVRLLIEVVDISAGKSGATVSLDDLAWVEWRTPWITREEDTPGATHATHVMLHSKP